MSETVYTGSLEVIVELPENERVQLATEAQIRARTIEQFYSRIIGIANQLGVQGRVIKELTMSPNITPWRQSATITFQEVEGGQLKRIRRAARSQAREHVRSSNRGDGANQVNNGAPGDGGAGGGATEPGGSRESDESEGTKHVLPFPDLESSGGDPR